MSNKGGRLLCRVHAQRPEQRVRLVWLVTQSSGRRKILFCISLMRTSPVSSSRRVQSSCPAAYSHYGRDSMLTSDRVSPLANRASKLCLNAAAALDDNQIIMHFASRHSFRTAGSCDPRAAVFELRQIVLGDSFPHYVHAGFWAGLRCHRHGRNFVFERVDFV
jgi:hypothetical protein